MTGRMKIFVASTFEDLFTHRDAARRSILTTGNISEDMLHWPAVERPPLDESLQRLRSSNLLILLIAHRYGQPPEGHDKSITELEYDEAVARGIPILCFTVDPKYAWPPDFVDMDPKTRSRLEAFTRKVGKKVTRAQFTSPESLEVAITYALAHHMEKSRETAVPWYLRARMRAVSLPESLSFSPDSTIQIGHAPDGLPLLLSVTRHIRVEDHLARIASRLWRAADGSCVQRDILAVEPGGSRLRDTERHI